MKEFYDARPPVSAEAGWSMIYRPPGESSEEAKLDVGLYGSVCGSMHCKRAPDFCRAQERHKMLYYLWQAWEPSYLISAGSTYSHLLLGRLAPAEDGEEMRRVSAVVGSFLHEVWAHLPELRQRLLPLRPAPVL